MNKPIKQLLSIILVTIALSGCSPVKEIQMGEIQDVRIRNIVNNRVGLELDLPVTNPGHFKLKIIEMDVDLSVNGKHLGKVTNPEKIIIPPQFDSIHTFPLQLELSNLLAGAMYMYRLKDMKNLEMQIKGKVKGRSFLYTKTVDVDEKHRLSW
ncbi:MAG: LEA type 2 family protein [Bacteroidales bacterium]|nr:LEA type 2 family protein [Bacteroidales bacterium]